MLRLVAMHLHCHPELRKHTGKTPSVVGGDCSNLAAIFAGRWGIFRMTCVMYGSIAPDLCRPVLACLPQSGHNTTHTQDLHLQRADLAMFACQRS